MLLGLGVCVLALLWVAFFVAICCICAAGGAADAKTEEWYAEHKKAPDPGPDAEKGAA
jgi:hypothetical protein